MKPGEYFLDDAAGDIVANAGRAAVRLLVRHTGDRPIQVGSHYHFYEVNRALDFDRSAAYGQRLNIPSGTAVRFEPGEEKEIELTPFGGSRVMFGHNGLVNGSLDAAGAPAAAEERRKGWESR
jgi:urease beta subunit